LEVQSRCNCRCVMCDIWKVKESREIAVPQAAAWLPEWRRLGVANVVLTGGEPLMHSDLAGLCRLLKDAGIAVTVLTSGILLPQRAALLAPLVDEVIVSLDGPRDVHDAIRGISGAFDRIAAGVAALGAARPSLPVSGRCTVQRANARHLAATVDAARAIGLVRISFLAVDAASDAFNRPGGAGETPAAALLVPAGELDELARALEELAVTHAADFASGFIEESPAKLRGRILGHFAAVAGAAPFPPSRCNAPWVSAVVGVDGSVRPCFFHPAYGALGDGEALGTLLNAPAARAFRASLDVATDPLCVRCVCRLNLRASPAPGGEASP
ncbi:MAG TPA: radical SAM protein, partial [Thermoanaerobaculia bacterium]|nr:radical SAM protein [Thermoanaerobaculia bacterium]